MNGLDSWIYVDYKKNIWKFSINNNKELCCNIFFREGKWKKEILIDKGVIGFAVCIEDEGKIHIVYSNLNGEIKYCTLKDNQWIGRILYMMDSDEFVIRNLNICIIRGEMHIFYLLIESNGGSRGVLMHSIWNGTDANTAKLHNISMPPAEKEIYLVKTDNKNIFNMLFVTGEGKSISVNHCSYKNGKWTSAKSLYSIQGHDIGFEMLNDQENLHILNKHKQGTSYYLDHVFVDNNGITQKSRVYESKKELTELLLFQSNNKLYSCWLEENRIYHSVFDGSNWSRPTYFNSGNEHKMEKYRLYEAIGEESTIKEKEVYGTSEIDLNLFFPGEFVAKEQQPLKFAAKLTEGGQRRVNKLNLIENTEILPDLELQLYQERSENNHLQQTIDSLNAKLQILQQSLDSYKERVMKTLEQKRYSDENCDMFLDLQKKLQTKLESLGRQLSEEKQYNSEIENKLRESEEEKAAIRKEMEKITEEKLQLQQEIEAEKNKTIIERFLKSRI